MKVTDNTARSRFEAEAGDDLAFVRYRLRGDTITFTYAEVPAPLRGQGLGDQVVRAALDAARARNLKVVPLCSFVAAFIRRNPEYQDLLKER